MLYRRVVNRPDVETTDCTWLYFYDGEHDAAFCTDAI